MHDVMGRLKRSITGVAGGSGGMPTRYSFASRDDIPPRMAQILTGSKDSESDASFMFSVRLQGLSKQAHPKKIKTFSKNTHSCKNPLQRTTPDLCDGIRIGMILTIV